MLSQVSSQKKKTPLVEKTQAYVSTNYVSGMIHLSPAIPKYCSSEQGTLVHYKLNRVKKGETDLKPAHSDPGHNVTFAPVCVSHG